MIHSIDKAKDMARSILPSRWRGAAQSRAYLHRRQRRTVSQSLHELARDPSRWDEGVDLAEDDVPDLAMLVTRRRQSDKLNHFERWAVARTRELPRVHRLGYLASVLPDGLIGQHAMSHLRRRKELAPERDDLRLTWYRRAVFLERGHLAQLLRELLTIADGVRLLHAALKETARRSEATRTEKVEFRPLRGQHDVLPFLDWLESRDERRAWLWHTGLATRHVVDLFCREFAATRNPEAAFHRAVRPAARPDRDYEYVRV